ncbi:cytochrome c oxidase subunit II [Rhodoplanes roseus]|uniref:Cytochrome aa3 subunit 2 n=1 Tax=Rhodoplanes roseus TaxID=29409 RepID=A0A327L648_9BRAD|nr:cytochrome c oxidase subunit II [Rhodoplanes roseus]RAI43108.1 cytochrome c oxidase subunit II [Rhodoplanes roseus]
MRRSPAGFRPVVVAAAAAGLAGCDGPLSTLDPAGPAAATIAGLWWAMMSGGIVLLTIVMALLAWAFLRPGAGRTTSPRVWLAGGGLVLPAVVLTPLLLAGLWAGERLLARPGVPGIVRVDVTARQWQWDFVYPDATPAVSTNVLHIPVGRPVDVHVTSADVIHSFWVPRLAGKIDAIPGHVTVVRLAADRPGVFHGVCAEFCGTAHAHMGFTVEAHAADAYEDRLRRLGRNTR